MNFRSFQYWELDEATYFGGFNFFMKGQKGEDTLEN